MIDQNNQDLVRHPPHSLDAERAVLGSALRDPSILNTIMDGVRPESFFSDIHRDIFSVMLDLDSEHSPVDIVTVAERLKRVRLKDPDGGLGYLIELTENVSLTQNAGYYAAIVREYNYLRRIIKTCQETIRQALSYQGKASGFVEDLEKEILAIFNEQDRGKGVSSALSILEDTIVELEQRIGQGGAPTGVPSGFTDLDHLTGGFQKGHLIILAARPGMGKTALALNFAMNAVKKSHPVLVFSLEMSKVQLMMRLLASESRVDSSKIVRGDLSEDEKNRLMHGARVIGTLPAMLGIDETPLLTLPELRSRARRFKKEHGLALLIVDYLQLMGSTSNRKIENREREIAEFSAGLKALAKELDVPVIALAQLNRGPDNRTDKRPRSSDLRESGSLEQDADLIMFVYRDEVYNKASEFAGQAEIIIEKNRHGPQATLMLAYQGSFVSFHNLLKQ